MTKQPFHKIKDHEHLVKDPKTGAVLLNDRSVVDEYKTRKNMLRTNADMRTEINNLKNEISEIKDLLLRVINK